MRAYVGVTDWDWYRHLAVAGAREVNFWQPSGGRRFRAVPQSAPFLFKTHFSHGNRIVGFGILSGWATLPMSSAWDFFGEGNGCGSLMEMRKRIGRYRGARDGGESDPEIGCIMLRDVVFVGPEEALPAPPDWKGNIVQGRVYDLESAEGSHVEQALRRLLRTELRPEDDDPSTVPGEMFGAPHLAPVRVGQAAFKALVQEAYNRRCAVTDERHADSVFMAS